MMRQMYALANAGIFLFWVQGEHGVGLVKRDYLPHELGESTVDAMRKVFNDLPSILT